VVARRASVALVRSTTPLRLGVCDTKSRCPSSEEEGGGFHSAGTAALLEMACALLRQPPWR
jgi:hypothetical protein